MEKSKLSESPKSVILERGYINVYSQLNVKERRQLFYNREYKKLNPSWDNTMILMCKMFELASGSKPIVLDAGCGNGNYIIDEYRGKIAWAYGVDADRQATSKNVCLDEIKYSSLEKIPYPNNEFDVVLSLWAIEHLENPQGVFKEIFRVLKPGGSFIFCTPNKDYFLLKIKQILQSRKINNLINKVLFGREERDIFPTFYRANDLTRLSSQLKSCGFSDVKLKPNYDPGYTSFESLSFGLSNWLGETKACGFLPHIVGICNKIL